MFLVVNLDLRMMVVLLCEVAFTMYVVALLDSYEALEGVFCLAVYLKEYGYLLYVLRRKTIKD